MRHVTAAFAVEAKLVLDDLVGEAEEERIAVGLVVVRVTSSSQQAAGSNHFFDTCSTQ